MSTMQEFYNKLMSDDYPQDADWQEMRLLTKAGLEQVTEVPDELGWYYWTDSEKA